MRFESERGVVGHPAGEDYLLIIPGDLLADLQAAWQSDDRGGTDFRAIVVAVREMFDGQDGALQFLKRLGVPTENT